MGGAGVAQFADPSVIYFNPAGSFFTPKSILIMHAENFAGCAKNDFGSIVLPNDKLTLGAGLQYVTVGDIKLTRLIDTTLLPGNDNRPIAYDTVGTKDLILYLNGSGGNSRFSYGTNIKVYYRDLVVINGFGGGGDVGIFLHLDYFNLGIAVRDFILSPLIWSNGTKEMILPRLSLGIAPSIPIEKINSKIIFECDFVKHLDIDGFETNIGLEFSHKNIISGRCGMYKSGFALGLGVLYKRLSIDYALVTHSALKNSNKISAGFIF